MVLVGNWGGGSVWRTTSGAFPSNAYFFETGRPGEAALIDPGLDGPTIEVELLGLGLRPTHIFCTHGHFDHVGSAAYFQKKYGTPVLLHEGDRKILASSNFLLMLLKIPQKVEQPQVTWVNDGFQAAFGPTMLRYLPAPGHTPGSCVIEFGATWFTGDTIYSRGVGLSSMPGEDVEKLKSSIHALWGGLADKELVCPGHGDVASGRQIQAGNAALVRLLGLAEDMQ